MPVLGEHSVANVLCYLHAKTFVYAENLSKKKMKKRGRFLAHLGVPKTSQVWNYFFHYLAKSVSNP